jgi:hypothetical protein
MTFTLRWTPAFSGIQPYVLHGLLWEKTEISALKLLQLLPTLADTDLIDPTPVRKLMTVVASLPYLYSVLRSRFERSSAAQISSDLSSLNLSVVQCIRNVMDTPREAKLRGIFGEYAEWQDSADSFLQAVCAEVVLVFGALTHHAAEFLHAMLTSQMSKYNLAIFKISNFLLQQPNSTSFVRGFQQIILAAHETVTRTEASAQSLANSDRLRNVHAAADLVATIISLHFHDNSAEGTDTETKEDEQAMLVLMPSLDRSQVTSALRRVLVETRQMSDKQRQELSRQTGALDN